jgi:hypothetical protein
LEVGLRDEATTAHEPPATVASMFNTHTDVQVGFLEAVGPALL